jgi:anti-sigma factor RsiW
MSRHVEKELSAYLDGECRRPARVEAHLRECAPCSARLEELRGLSRAVKALPRAEVRPEFVTRVIARADESRERAGGLGRLRYALFAAACVFVATAAFVAFHGDKDNGSTGEERAARMLDQRLDLAIALEDYLDATFPPAEPDSPEAEVPDEVVADMASTGLFAMLADEVDGPEAPEDVDALVENMNAAELAEFEQLLREYQEEV